MAFAPNTVKLLAELKNTSDSRHRRGLIAEFQVIKLYLEKGFILKSHRTKYFNTEIDIVMTSANKVVVIEVKYSSHEDFLFYRMSPTQKRRLKNVYLRLSSLTEKDLEFHYVVVSQSGEILIFDDFLTL